MCKHCDSLLAASNTQDFSLIWEPLPDVPEAFRTDLGLKEATAHRGGAPKGRHPTIFQDKPPLQELCCALCRLAETAGTGGCLVGVQHGTVQPGGVNSHSPAFRRRRRPREDPRPFLTTPPRHISDIRVQTPPPGKPSRGAEVSWGLGLVLSASVRAGPRTEHLGQRLAFSCGISASACPFPTSTPSPT